jgi:hypothetical protein
MFRHAVMQYWVYEYIMDTYVCEKCKFIFSIDSPSHFEKTQLFYYDQHKLMTRQKQGWNKHTIQILNCLTHLLTISTITKKEVLANTSLCIHFHMKVRAIVSNTAAIKKELACWHFLWSHVMRQGTASDCTTALQKSVLDWKTLAHSLEKSYSSNCNVFRFLRYHVYSHKIPMCHIVWTFTKTKYEENHKNQVLEECSGKTHTHMGAHTRTHTHTTGLPTSFWTCNIITLK